MNLRENIRKILREQIFKQIIDQYNLEPYMQYY
jgi:hypothetical protein